MEVDKAVFIKLVDRDSSNCWFMLNLCQHGIWSLSFLRWMCADSNYFWTVTGLGYSHLTHSLAIWHLLCCLKGLWNVEQIPSALSAWTHSPLAPTESRGLTECHVEARNEEHPFWIPVWASICHQLVPLTSFLLSGCEYAHGWLGMHLLFGFDESLLCGAIKEFYHRKKN